MSSLDRTLLGGFRKVEGGSPPPPEPRSSGRIRRALLLSAVHLAAEAHLPLRQPQRPPRRASSRWRTAPISGNGSSSSMRATTRCASRSCARCTPQLDALARALEMLLHQPVTASAFWSQGGLRAPVHYDDHDLIVVQLRGTKRWYVSSRPSELNNTWKSIPEGAPELGPHHTVDVRPGDLMYFPRGTLHSVDGEAESLHLSIGFTPLTVRDAVIAALDQLSDLDRGWRMTFGGPLALLLRGPGLERFNAPTVEAAANLAVACKTPGFLASALQARSSRAFAALEALPVPQAMPVIDLDTELAAK